MPPLTLHDIAAFLNAYFTIEDYGVEGGGIYRDVERSISRIGIALEPWPGLSAWMEAEQIDALFLHRPWKFDALLQSAREEGESERQQSLLENTGVLFYHLPFDEYLTLGDSPRLADALLLSGTEILGTKDERPLGMIGDIKPQPFADVLATVDTIFGGHEDAVANGTAKVTRLAIVGAMTEALVREAAGRGAGVYLTGQFRVPARSAVRELEMGVVAVGHQRSEQWGLRALAGLLRERFCQLEVIVAP